MNNVNGNVNGIDTQLLDLMLRAGSHWVLYLLLGLSLAAVAIMLERLWFFVQERPPTAAIAAAMGALRKSGTGEALEKLSGTRSMQAAVARACLAHAADGPAAVDEHKAAAIESERGRYERRLAFLGTLGNNAPFVGLFGTVLGIIRAFHDLAGNTMQGTQAVMSGIAEALVATGIGLLVALPAVACFNLYQRVIRARLGRAQALCHEVMAFRKGSVAQAAE